MVFGDYRKNYSLLISSAVRLYLSSTFGHEVFESAGPSASLEPRHNDKDGRLIRLDYVLAKPRLAARSNIISLIKRLGVYFFFQFQNVPQLFVRAAVIYRATLAFGSCLRSLS